MRGYRFGFRTPLEIGDVVAARYMGKLATFVVTDIFTVHVGSTGEVKALYELDCRSDLIVPLRALKCRLDRGRFVPLACERTVCEEVEL